MGYRDVLNTIHESCGYIPIRSSYILQLHRDLYKYSERGIGGRFKSTHTDSQPQSNNPINTKLKPNPNDFGHNSVISWV